MKKISVLLLIISFALQSFGSVWVYVDYRINNADYLKNCINKARPMLNCQGKCQVAKKIKEQEEKKKQEQDKKPDNKPEITLSSKTFFPSVVFTISKKQQYFLLLNKGQAVSMPRSILRPPIC